MVNVELGCLDSKIGNMIILACDRILNGEFQDQFVVDVSGRRWNIPPYECE